MEKLADEFMRSTPPAAEALHAAGFETRTDENTGELLMRVEGRWVAVKAAAKQGLI
jgi:hypothetical protein